MQKSSRARFFIAFLAMIGTAFFLFFAWKIYLWKSGKEPDLIAEAVRQAEQKDYAIAMADTYGGKTPQETLQMYIDAVEKGDYELASRYFVKSKQEEELRALQAAEKADIDNVIKLMKETENDSGSYSVDRKTFIVRKPILTEYTFYPSGIWKIVEI